MPYQSIDELQKVFTDTVFSYAADSKKAAGRALGTLVEIITFYTLKSWGFEQNVAIETPLPEYGNNDITHNVEYTLHPSNLVVSKSFSVGDLPLSAKKISKIPEIVKMSIVPGTIKTNSLLGRSLILRNSCTVWAGDDFFVNAYLQNFSDNEGTYSVAQLRRHPFAMFECKRVGVEEGMKKGPQTIEKAKQGAYVARTVSALQRLRLKDGSIGGFIQKLDDSFRHGNYYELMAEIIASDDPELLSHFILTVGIVSNHGNWFTSDNHNKELRVLAQSYDWLLFLTDTGLAKFVDDLILNPANEFIAVKDSFLASYTGNKGKNEFTKVKISLQADLALQSYFRVNSEVIKSWFNVIAPRQKALEELIRELSQLKDKNWEEIFE